MCIRDSYETLIRHHDDGSIGAHHVRINEILRDGVVIQASVGTAIPLSVAEGQGGLSLADVLGEATSLALLRLEKLEAEGAAMTTALEETQEALAEAKVQADNQQQTITAQQEEIARLMAELSGSQSLQAEETPPPSE